MYQFAVTNTLQLNACPIVLLSQLLGCRRGKKPSGRWMVSHTEYYVEVWSKEYSRSSRGIPRSYLEKAQKRATIGLLCGDVRAIVLFIWALAVYKTRCVRVGGTPLDKQLEISRIFNPHIFFAFFSFLTLARSLAPSLFHARSLVLVSLSLSSNGFCPTLQSRAETSQPLQA